MAESEASAHSDCLTEHMGRIKGAPTLLLDFDTISNCRDAGLKF